MQTQNVRRAVVGLVGLMLITNILTLLGCGGDGGDDVRLETMVPSLDRNSFSAATTFAAGDNPAWLGPGDFNRDGILDLAVAEGGIFANPPNEVTLLLGDGTGAFTLASSLVVGEHLGPGAVGDFNEDGNLDLAIADLGGPDCNGSAGFVAILLGDGNGGFVLERTVNAGNGPNAVAMGDINLDGRLDLAVPNKCGENVSILLGDGSGDFSLAGSFRTRSTPFALAVGDFNRDGNLDIVTGNVFSSSEVSVLLGDGTGALSEPNLFGDDRLVVSIATGDFNRDGVLDLAVPDQSGNRDLAIMFGDGQGSFVLANNVDTGNAPSNIVVADFNGDDLLDLAASAPEAVTVLLGDGQGGFAAPTTIVDTAGPLAVADFNTDGVLDLAVAHHALFQPGGVVILLGVPSQP